METIGECKCLYGFDKEIIELAISDKIKFLKKDIEGMKKDLSKTKNKFVKGDIKAIINNLERAIELYNIVLEKIRAMPTCE